MSILGKAHELTMLAGALGGAVLTGNIAGAVVSIVGVFAGGGPTPEQMILDEIEELQKQVSALHEAMEDRFEQLYRGLNQMYLDIETNFNHIDVRLGQLTEDVHDIQESLAGVGTDVNRLYNYLLYLEKEQEEIPLLTAINVVIPRIGGEMAEDEFRLFENVFHAWATIFSSG